MEQILQVSHHFKSERFNKSNYLNQNLFINKVVSCTIVSDILAIYCTLECFIITMCNLISYTYYIMQYLVGFSGINSKYMILIH